MGTCDPSERQHLMVKPPLDKVHPVFLMIFVGQMSLAYIFVFSHITTNDQYRLDQK